MSDEHFMDQALDLAARGVGFVEPNPTVGAVLVKEGQVIGRGWHAAFGGPHAEVMALADAGSRVEGADLYVTLEPCSTDGKTPPCTDAVRAAGLSRVFYAVPDPNPAHRGRAAALRAVAGSEVRGGLLEERARELLKGFRAWLDSTRPWVVAKWAQTLDGRIATRTGDSQWITGEPARIRVHEERARAQGILVGIGTALADDPALTVRHAPGPSPRRFVVDSQARLPVTAAMITDEGEAPTVFCLEDAEAARRDALSAAGARVVTMPADAAGRCDLAAVMPWLRENGVDRLMVEGGGQVLGSLLEARLADRVQVFIAPKILGDGNGAASVTGRDIADMSDALDLADVSTESIGEDLLVSARVR